MSKAMRRFWIQLTADRRRFGVLCATFGVGLLLWARLIIVSNVSRTAVAETESTGLAAAATDKSSDKPSNVESDARATLSGQVVEVRLWSQTERDPFVISREHFPRSVETGEVKQEAGKLPTEPAEDLSQKEARFVARLREVLGTLKLEAAMGDSMAIIDGKRYRVGDRLPPMGTERLEFTIAAIRQRSVVLDYQGRRFEVDMSVPGAKWN